MKVVVIDARDSFVHILGDYLRTAGAEVDMVRPDLVGLPAVLDRVRHPTVDGVVLGPGPGHPADSSHVPVLRAALGRLPILGVCLGHQAIGLAFGARIVVLHQPMHGKRSNLVHDGGGVLRAVPPLAPVTRYHSLVVEPALAAGPWRSRMRVDGVAEDDGSVLALTVGDNVFGVQFHPESHGSKHGHVVIANFLDVIRRRAAPRRPGAVRVPQPHTAEERLTND
jgi:anthranilate synthase component 2